MTKILAAIMCGGSRPPRERESRASLPKPFIPLIGDRSSFQSIVDFVGDRTAFDGPVVITNFDDRLLVAEQLKEIGAEATILLEPQPRFSAAAVGALASYASARDPQAIVAVLTADHVFRDREKFVALCARAGAVAAAGEIVTFGVTPDHPATASGSAG
jgi:mannose-1-phosphate guanylyltransferase/mannose-6-phosphate isomerase